MERKEKGYASTQKGGVAYPYYQLFKRLRDQNSLFTQHGSWADPP